MRLLPGNSPRTTTECGRVVDFGLFMVALTATTLYLHPAPAEHDALLVLADDAEPEHIGPSFLQRAVGASNMSFQAVSATAR
jgi:hypothetical protein